MAKLPLIERRVEWLKVAEEMGVGVANSSRIKLVEVSPP